MFKKFENEIVGDNIDDFFHPEEIRENNNDFTIHDFGSPRQKYLKRIWTNYINLKWELKRLQNVEVFFSIEKIPDHYKEGGVHNLEYYNYHYEYFRIKSISVVDYLFLFINHCLQMGIPLKKCNFYSITENTNIKNSDLVQSLKEFDQEISSLKTDRNKIIHEGTFEPQIMVPLNDLILEYEENVINEDDIEKGDLKREEINKAIIHFRNEINMINAHVEKVLNNLIPHIKKQIEIFKLDE